MNAPTSPRPPVTRLDLPTVEAAPFLRGFIERDTRGCALDGERMLNRFPASQYCVLNWFLEGGAELLPDDGVRQAQRLDGCTASGCQTRPFASRNLGDVHVFMAAFHPDAFHVLFGTDLGALQDRFADVRAVLPAHGLALVDAVFAAGSGAARRAAVEGFVRERARLQRLPPWPRIRRMGGRITLGMASTLLGIGPRQLQRLALREAGASLQTLARLRRGERSFLGAQRRYLRGRAFDGADHALAHDYADQSHMVRDCKAQTGRTPTQLMRDVLTEEADWIYRLELPDDDDNDDEDDRRAPSRPA